MPKPVSVSQMGLGEVPSADDDARQAFAGDPAANLFTRFAVPPFSVLQTNTGYWQDRRRAWLGLGIESELGRDEKLLGFDSLVGEENTGKYDGLGALGTTSVFDPVLCELMVRWFSAPGARVLDPFAGGSVRGIVAARLGRSYTGIDLRPEQVAANQEQAARICRAEPVPYWIAGDSGEVLARMQPCAACWGEARVMVQADGKQVGACRQCAGARESPYALAITCPPYFDLEQYSDDPRDLSNAGSYEAFIAAYRNIIALTAACLRPDSFACFVVSEIRDKRGIYRGFVGDTIAAFEDAGMAYYNEAILVNAVGSLAVRATRQFGAGRKFGRQHQNVLVFVKGDGKAAARRCGEVDADMQAVLGAYDEGNGSE